MGSKVEDLDANVILCTNCEGDLDDDEHHLLDNDDLVSLWNGFLSRVSAADLQGRVAPPRTGSHPRKYDKL